MHNEIKDMREYNPRYTERGYLKWQKINTGKHPKKVYPLIPIDRIRCFCHKYNEEVLQESRKQYQASGELIPVRLRNYDYRLWGGYEQYLLAKELGIKEIPYIIWNDSSVMRKPYCNKTKLITDCTGKPIYVSPQAYKKIRECLVICKTIGYRFVILPIYRFKIYDNYGHCIRKKEFELNAAYKRLKSIQESLTDTN